MPLPVASGTVLSYGDLTFDSLFSTDLRGTPEYSEDGRTVIYTTWRLKVSGYVNVVAGSGLTTDDYLDDYIPTLTTPGLRLRYKRGGSDFTLTAGGNGAQDVAWGPKPISYHYRPAGSNQSAFVDWEVEWRAPSCTSAKYRNVPASICWSQSWTVDGVTGLTTIKTSSSIVIPLTRLAPGNRRLNQTADDYRNLIHFMPPLGFQRKESNYTLSQDRLKLTGEVTDQQMPFPLPAGVSMAQATHSVSSDMMKDGFYMWDGSIRATLQAPVGTPKTDLWSKFMLIVSDRINQTLRGLAMPGGAGLKPNRKPDEAGVLITHWELSDDIFSLGASFVCAYRVMGVGLEFILLNSGLWRPIAGTDFGQWAASMALPWSSRGQAGAYFDPRGDAIIDLCVGGNNAVAFKPKVNAPVQRVAAPKAVVLRPPVPPGSSWLTYKNSLHFHEDPRLIRHKPLAEPPTQTPALRGTLPENLKTVASAQGSPRALMRSSATHDAYQAVGTPSYAVTMMGGACRAGYRIPVPRLVSVGGSPAIFVGQDVHEDISGSAVCPIVTQTWAVRYLLDGPPRLPVPTMPNPAHGIGSYGADAIINV